MSERAMDELERWTIDTDGHATAWRRGGWAAEDVCVGATDKLAYIWVQVRPPMAMVTADPEHTRGYPTTLHLSGPANDVAGLLGAFAVVSPHADKDDFEWMRDRLAMVDMVRAVLKTREG